MPNNCITSNTACFCIGTIIGIVVSSIVNNVVKKPILIDILKSSKKLQEPEKLQEFEELEEPEHNVEKNALSSLHNCSPLTVLSSSYNDIDELNLKNGSSSSSVCGCDDVSIHTDRSCVYIKSKNEYGDDILINRKTKNIYKYTTTNFDGFDYSKLTLDKNTIESIPTKKTRDNHLHDVVLVHEHRLKELTFLEKNLDSIIKCYIDEHYPNKINIVE